jgi:DNA-binding MarR family transcriptional regulator
VSRHPTPLQRELRQKRPFQSPAHEALVDLLHTADVVRRRLAAVIEPAGITVQQFNVLRILRGAGDEGLPTLEVAARMIEQTPGITRLLDRLEAKALVRRQRCPKDRRQHLCWITPAGRTLLDRLDAPVLAVGDRIVGELDAPGRRRLIQLLDTVRKAPG